jgi:tape measure domain-containing protein
MANDRVQAKIDITKGRDETAAVKNSLSSFSDRIKTAQNTVADYGAQLDKASQGQHKFGDALSRVGEIAAGVGIANAIGTIAQKLADLSTAGASFAFNSAVQMEQWKIAFDTMLQDSGKASKLLSDITKFAKETPFELSQLIEGSKRLLAYNVSAEQVIPTMKMLGDIAAGVGTEKLPQLLLAYGQVNAATKLTGAELRQFAEAGVPLLEALVTKANEGGGALTKVGGASADTTKKTAALSAKLVDMQFNMDLLTKYGKNNGMQWEKLQHNYEKTKNELAKFGSVGQAVYKRVKVDAEQMIEKVSGGEIKFKDVHEALLAMTTDGGKFANLMGKQMDTVGTKLSNLKDNMFKLSLMIMGFDMKEGSETFGEVKEGSIFDRISKGLASLVSLIEANEGNITGFFDRLVQTGEAFWGVLQRLGAQIQTAFTPALNRLNEIYAKHKEAIDSIATIMGGVLYAAISILIEVLAKLLELGAIIVEFWLTQFGPTFTYVADVITQVGAKWDQIVNGMRLTFESVVNGVIDGVNRIIEAFNKLSGLNIAKLGMMTTSSVAAPAFAPTVAPSIVAGGASYSRNVSITNNNNFSSMLDANKFASYQAWQINGR